MATEDTIQIRCSRCKLKFRDKATRVRDGYSRQCPSCERVMFFIDGSPNKEIHEALREAERKRKVLRDEQAEAMAARSAAAAAPPAEPSDDHAATHPATGRRTIDRRSYTSGRT